MSNDISKAQEIIKKAEEWAKRKEQRSSKKYKISGALWVSPDGTVRTVADGAYHINDVIQNPEVFGYTRKQIEALYNEYGERLGQEGDARDSLMTNLLKDGWVRVRVRRNHYSVQVWNFDPNTYTKLENLATVLIEDGINGEFASEHDELKVNSLKTGKMKSLTMGEVLKGFLYESEEKNIDYNFFTG